MPEAASCSSIISANFVGVGALRLSVIKSGSQQPRTSVRHFARIRSSPAPLVVARVSSGNDPLAKKWVLHHLAGLLWDKSCPMPSASTYLLLQLMVAVLRALVVQGFVDRWRKTQPQRGCGGVVTAMSKPTSMSCAGTSAAAECDAGVGSA